MRPASLEPLVPVGQNRFALCAGVAELDATVVKNRLYFDIHASGDEFDIN